jgi:SWI/SNF-related matrix-associated actin-dependent regulator of chromatin subfamily A-like protein 1
MTQLSLHQVQKVDLSSLLYRYQKLGANWLHNKTAALLADQMGLGKTVQAIAAIRDDEGAIVVCPASLLENWKREIDKFRPELRIVTHYPHPGEVLITAYSRLPSITEGDFPKLMVIPKHPFTLILDEGHYVKSAKAERTKKVRALSAASARTWILTGTPLLNKPPELWALLQACKWSGKKVFGSWDEFVDLFQGKKKHFGGYTWGDPLPAAGERLSKFMLRRTREEVLPELPTKTFQEHCVKLSKSNLLGQDFRFIDAWSDKKVEDESIEGGALSSVRVELAEAKLSALLELVESFREAEEPVVVFSAHRSIPMHLGARPGWARITGDVPPKDREKAVRAFQDGHLEGIAGTIGAMGVGLTLTRAAHVLFVDRSFVPAENMQAEDRLVRIGQTRGVVVHSLVADHAVDLRVAMILEKKMRLLEGTGLT